MTRTSLRSGVSDATLNRLYTQYGGEQGLWLFCAEIYRKHRKTNGPEMAHQETYEEMSQLFMISKGVAESLYYQLKVQYEGKVE